MIRWPQRAPVLLKYRAGQKWVFSCDRVHSRIIFLLITLLFSVRTTVNLLSPTPCYVWQQRDAHSVCVLIRHPNGKAKPNPLLHTCLLYRALHRNTTWNFVNVRAVGSNSPGSNAMELFVIRCIHSRSRTSDRSSMSLKATLSDKEIPLTLEWLQEAICRRDEAALKKSSTLIRMCAEEGGSCRHGDFTLPCTELKMKGADFSKQRCWNRWIKNLDTVSSHY